MSDGMISGKPSKSARKREITALQQLADEMAALSDDELSRLGVEVGLREQLRKAREIKPSGARNRQLKHCVRYMDPELLGQVREYLTDRQSQRIVANQRFHEIEHWRDRLVLSGDEALAELIDADPTLDRQRLRQLVRDAQREVRQGSPAGAGKKLFRFLRNHRS
jgi:ribosome-associated protein